MARLLARGPNTMVCANVLPIGSRPHKQNLTKLQGWDYSTTPMPCTPSPLGTRLRAARDRSGLSRHKVAVAVGVVPTTIRGWERGEAEPRAGQLQPLAQALGTTVCYILDLPCESCGHVQ